MQIKWKKNKNLKPEIILEKIDSAKSIRDDGEVSFKGFIFQNAMTALLSMLDFPKELSSIKKENIIFRAISSAAKDGRLEKLNTLESINTIVKKETSTKNRKFHLLTSLSLKKPLPYKTAKIESCKIRLIEGNYPKKYSSRSETIIRSMFKTDYATPRNYTNVIVTVQAKDNISAASKCLRGLDIQRAIWCMFANASTELIGDAWKPINRIRHGQIQTVHNHYGKSDINTIWFEPNYLEITPYSSHNTDLFSDNSKWAASQLEKSKYSNNIKEALLRYVRALDEKDQNTALIRLWGAIECLAAPGNRNYDQITKRCSFLFSEAEYHRQVLEHLREYRNKNVHAGEENDSAKLNCYQLQYYFRELILFHLRNVNEFDNLDEANQYLDLPTNNKLLAQRKVLIDKAIKFRGSE